MRGLIGTAAVAVCRPRSASGLWPMVRRKAVFGRYAVLRCLWPVIRIPRITKITATSVRSRSLGFQ
eukprot:4699394-Prymnesium_polylepis.1